MRNLYYILIVLVAIGSFSCESPLNVPANRQIDITVDPFLNPPIHVSPTYKNLGFVHPDSQLAFKIEAQNKLDKSYIIWDYNLFFNKNGFSISNKSIPLNLQPEGEENSGTSIEIVYKADKPGIYHDTLLFANLIYPFTYMEAVVPNVYMDDVVFNSIRGEQKVVIVHNLSDSKLTITDAYFSNDTKNFTILDSLPVNIASNSINFLKIQYTPGANDDDDNSMILKISGLSDKKLTDSICKIKIIK